MLALFDETIFTTLPASTARWTARSTRRAAAPAAAVVPSRSCDGARGWAAIATATRRVTAEVTQAAMAIQSDHVLRGLEAARAADRADPLGLRTNDVPPSRALRRALARDAAAAARRRDGARADAARTRRIAASSAWRRTGWPRPGRARPAPTTGPRLPDRTSTCCSGRSTRAARRGWRGVSSNTCAGRSRRSGSTWRRWRCGSIRAVLAAARERSSRRRGPVAAVGRDPRGARHVPGDRATSRRGWGRSACERVIVSFTRSAADLAGVLALARARRARGPAATWSRSRCSSRAASSRPRHRILDDVVAMPGARRLLRRPRRRARGDGGLLRLGQGGRACSPRTSSCTRAQRAMAAWARERGLRLTIFHGRGGALGPRRRAREPGDRGRAARLGGRPVQGHRAGRGGVRALRERRARAAPSGADDERRRPGERRAAAATTIRPTVRVRDRRRCRRRRARTTKRWSGPRASSSSSAA